jgi:hypothetical protein
MSSTRLLSVAGLATALGFAASSALAQPFLPNEVQLLEDNDFEILLNANGTVKTVTPTTVIQQGDLFAGILKIQATENVPSGANSTNFGNADETFTAIFLIETKNVASTGNPNIIDNSVDTLTFQAPGAAAWATVFGAGGTFDLTVEANGFDVTNLEGSGTGVLSTTMVMVFDDVILGNATPLGTTAASVDSHVGDLIYELGETGTGGLGGEFWSTIGIDAAIPALAGTNNPTNRLAINETANWGGPQLIAHNFLGTNAPFDLNYTSPVQVQGKGDFAGVAQGTWPLGTDTDLYILTVPEPGVLALLGLGIVGMGMAGRRRRRA